MAQLIQSRNSTSSLRDAAKILILAIVLFLCGTRFTYADGTLTLTPVGGPFHIGTNHFIFNAHVVYPDNNVTINFFTFVVSAPAGSFYSGDTTANFIGINGATINGNDIGAPDVAGTYVFQVKSTTSDGKVGPSATITFTAIPQGPDHPPIISAAITSSPPFRINYPISAQLTSTAYDGAVISKLTKSYTSKPAGSGLNDDSISDRPYSLSSIAWPLGFDVSGSYTLSWTATDSYGRVSAPFITTIFVDVAGPRVIGSLTSSGPFSVNVPIPFSIVKTEPQGPIVQIDVTFTSKPTGSAVTGQSLPGSATSMNLTVDVGGSYQVSFVGTDSLGNVSPPWLANFSANSSNPPVITDITAKPTTMVLTQGGAAFLHMDVLAGNSTDPVTAITWSETDPLGAISTINPDYNPIFHSSDAVFGPTLPGIYTFTTKATTSTGASASASVSVTAIQIGALTASPGVPMANSPLTLTVASIGGDPSPLDVEWIITDSSGNQVDPSEIHTSGNPIQAVWSPTCAGQYAVSATVNDALIGTGATYVGHTVTVNLAVNVLQPSFFSNAKLAKFQSRASNLTDPNFRE